MHIKLSTPRKLLWHYRVATHTIRPASEELPYDDHTTGGPCYAGALDHDSGGSWAGDALCTAHLAAERCHVQPGLCVGVSRESPGDPGRTHPNSGPFGRRDEPTSPGST